MTRPNVACKLALLAVIAVLQAIAADRCNEISTELERLVNARNHAWYAGDGATYRNHVTKTFLWNGVAVGRRMRMPVSDGRPFGVSEFRAIEYGTTAVVSYVLTEYLDCEEGSPFDQQRRLEVWIKTDNGWQTASVESHDVSPIY